MLEDLYKMIGIGRSVGNNMDNDEGDVLNVKTALNSFDYFDANDKDDAEPHGIFTRKTDDAIRNYQRDNDLREDGFLRPEGETESTLNADIALHNAREREKAEAEQRKKHEDVFAIAPQQEDEESKVENESSKTPRPETKPLIISSEKYEEAMKSFDFNEDGEKEIGFGIQKPLASLVGLMLAKQTQNDANEEYPHLEKSRNNEKDAYRHLLFGIRLTRTLGAKTAKRILDAHERKGNQGKGDKLMDLTNNQIAVQEAINPKNKNKKAEDLAKKLLQNKSLIKNGVIVKNKE